MVHKELMLLINRSEHVYWELVPLEGTPRWRSFIRNACQVSLPMILFVQVFQKGGSSSQVHDETEDVDREVVNKGNKRGKKWILRVSRHLEVTLSLVILMGRRKPRGDETISERVRS
jgi:hypothetical protein